MVATNYTYLKNSFSDGISIPDLENEIRSSTNIEKTLDSVFIVSDLVYVRFTEELSTEEKSSLDSIVSAHKRPLELSDRRMSDGTLIVATTKTDFQEVRIISSNFCDKTTWYGDSVRVENERLIQTDAVGKMFGGKYRGWIDLQHGKVPQEDKIPNVTSYYPIIKVYNADGEEIDGYMQKDFDTLIGDYDINYRTGIITFDEPISSDGYVEASYSYATKSTTYIRPNTGKKLDIIRAEVQFTQDVEVLDTAVFESFVYASVVESALGLPFGTLGGNSVKLQAKSPTKYKTAADYVAEANGNYAPAPAFGGSGWRGLKSNIITLPFDYETVIPMLDSQGTEIRVYLEDDREFEGTYATVTFYCQSIDEEN